LVQKIKPTKDISTPEDWAIQQHLYSGGYARQLAALAGVALVLTWMAGSGMQEPHW